MVIKKANMPGNTIFKQIQILALITIITLTQYPSLSLAKSNDISFEPVRESVAFKAFVSRQPVNEYSKILYLIDRFEQSKIQIVYEGHYYNADFAAKVSRWFLARRYKDETAKKWIMQWCNTTVPSGNLIWVKLSNGKFKLSREILLDELKSLETEATRSFFDKTLDVSKDSSAQSLPAEIGAATISPIPIPAANASN